MGVSEWISYFNEWKIIVLSGMAFRPCFSMSSHKADKNVETIATTTNNWTSSEFHDIMKYIYKRFYEIIQKKC